jgi:type III restriction enzyme
MVFTGFKKCLVTLQKFDSDAKRRFALACEDDPAVLTWVRPARDDNDIKLADGSLYHVDFVVEASDAKYMIEAKRADRLEQEAVVAKAQAAKHWCRVASHHARNTGDKEWCYLLLPDTSIKANSTLAGLVQTPRSRPTSPGTAP